MSAPTEFISVDPQTGDSCVMQVRDGVAHEISSDQMRQDLRDLGYAFSDAELGSVGVARTLALPALPSSTESAAGNDDGIEEFVKSFERAYLLERE